MHCGEQELAQLFELLQPAIREWLGQQQGGADRRHSLSIVLDCGRRSAEQAAQLQSFCDQWNAAAALDGDKTLFLELSLGDGRTSWLQASNKVDLFAYPPQVGAMHCFDTEWLLQQSELRGQQLEQEARALRLANPVQRPAPVPWNIRWQLAAYLRLEYGESFWSRRGLKPWQLRFDGEHVIDGVPTQFWRYPSSEGHSWASVERLDDTICLGFADGPPPGA